MKAVLVSRLDGPSSLEVHELDRTSRGTNEVLVQVHTVAPAFPDLLMSRGRYQVVPELPFSPGSDFAGIVLESDPGSEFTPGDRVAGCLSYGAAAEVLSVGEDRLYPLPQGLTFVDAAALPMNYLTAHFALVTRGGIQAGEWVLVTGASGGVGLASIQVAKGLGAHVIAVVSTPERADVAFTAGADHAVVRDDVPTKVKDLTGGHGVDLVVEVVGGDLVPLLRVMAPLGRVMIVGFASGEIPQVPANRLLLRNIDARGVESDYLWRHSISRRAWDNLMDMYRAGHIRPIVHDSGSLTSYASALESLESRAAVGRPVLTV